MIVIRPPHPTTALGAEALIALGLIAMLGFIWIEIGKALS